MKRFFSSAAAGIGGALSGIGGFVRKLWNHPKGRVGLVIALLLAVCAVFAPFIAPYDPYDVTQRVEKGLSPSLQHPLGTTITTGQDIFSMLIYGARVSLVVGIVTGLATAFLGAFMGVLTGYVGGLADMLVMRLVDIMLVIPTLPLTIVLTNLFGKSYFMIIFIFTLFGWTGLARVVRSQVLVLKNSNYVRAAELAGAGIVIEKAFQPGGDRLRAKGIRVESLARWRRRGCPSWPWGTPPPSAGAGCWRTPRAAARCCSDTGGGSSRRASAFSCPCSPSCASAWLWRKSSTPG